MPIVRYPPVGECIYCGATRYSEKRAKLGAEHIIPEGLGGTLLLEEASCARCEAKICSVEGYCLRKVFGPIRYALKLRSKRPKDRPTTIPVDFTYGGPYITEEVPIEEMPPLLYLPGLKIPGIIRGEPPVKEHYMGRTIYGRVVNDAVWATILEKRGAKRLRTPALPVGDERFGIMLAKIGHSYSAANPSEMIGFKPLLNKLIIGEASPWPLNYLVGDSGGIHPLFEPALDADTTGVFHHRIGCQIYELDSERSLLCVLIRLFDGLIANPVYRVVVGANFDVPVDPTFKETSS